MSRRIVNPCRLAAQRLRTAAITRMDEDAVRWRSLGALFVAGGLLALGSLALPIDAGTHVAPIAAVGGVAVTAGTIQIVWAAGLPRGDRWVSLALAFGTLLITLAVIFNHSAASPYALIYVWVGFDGFFFLSRRAAYGHLAWVGIAYATALVVTASHQNPAAGRWLLMMGTVAVIGTLADVLRTRGELLIGQLQDAARTDALTGLLNRRGFEEELSRELARSDRTGRPVSLVAIDLDHFKLVNDRFGHARGDEVLRALADLSLAENREVDRFGRVGGEEFALILPDTTADQAFLVAERMRRLIRSHFSREAIALSGSFGVATYPLHARDLDQLMRVADQAMYLSKRLGRDRTIIFGPEVTSGFRNVGEAETGRADQLPAVLVLAETLDMRDAGTALHSQTVAAYAESIAETLALERARVDRVRLAGLLHDIGKIGVPDPVLRKTGPLDDHEWAEMRKHPELGARILAGAGLDDISEWVLAHHERPDGRGYPFGLTGDDIPLEAKILSVADAFEAMTAHRPYRNALGFDAAVGELVEQSGKQFEPMIVRAFLSSLDGDAARQALNLSGMTVTTP